MKLPKLSLPVAGMSFKAFIIVLVILWLVTTLAGYGLKIVAATTDTPWVLTVAQAIAYISGAISALFLLWGLWSFAVRVARVILPLLFTTQTVDLDPAPPAPASIEEAPAIRQNLAGLDEILFDLELGSSAASLRLLDADQYAANLVGLIKGIVLKAEAMQAEAVGLQTAAQAIATRDPLQVAAAAGRVKDRHIRELLLCDAQPDNGYWLNVARLIAVQLGTIEQWATGYDKFASQLLAEVSGQKARMSALAASLDLMGTARPLLEIQSRLDEAQTYLQPERQPALVPAFKSLPAINAGLLGGGAP